MSCSIARYAPILALPLTLLTLPIMACSSSSEGDDEVAEAGTDSTGESDTTSSDSGTDDETTTETTDSPEGDTTETTTDTTETDTTESDTTDTGGEFTLTSPAFVEGGTIPDDNACVGANVSPQLDWINAPPESQSFAVFFEDLTISFSHSAIFDIPADATGLPADVDKQAMPADVPGATQPRSYANNFGYAGPCPGSAHTYQFTVYAIDVANLAEIDQNSSLDEVKTAFEQHAYASATLSGEFTPP